MPRPVAISSTATGSTRGRAKASAPLDSLYSDIDSLVISAGMHSVHFGKYHRLLSKRFPFAVYYRVEEQAALVYAVLDCRRRPAWIRKRLGEDSE